MSQINILTRIVLPPKNFYTANVTFSRRVPSLGRAKEKNEVLFSLNPRDLFLKNYTYVIMKTCVYAKRRTPTCLRGTKQPIEATNLNYYRIESICAL